MIASVDKQPEDRGDDRDEHRDDRPERERQDERRGDDPDQLAGLRAGLGDLLAELPAGLDLEAGGLRRFGRGVDDVLGLPLRERAGADLQPDGQIPRRLVLAQRRRALGRERVDDRGDFWLLREIRCRLVDRV